MDDGYLTSAGKDPAAERIVAGYLSALSANVMAGARTRARLVAEISDGFSCAVDRYRREGLSAAEAAQAAVAEFGDPAALASAFNQQLAPVAAHRIGLALVVTGPVVGLAWVGAYPAGSPDWRTRIGEVLSAVPFYPVILAVTVPACLLAVVGAGGLARRVPLPGVVAVTAALVATIGCVAGDVSLLAAVILARAAGDGPTAAMMVAVVASLARLSGAGLAGRRIARLRAAGS